MKQWISEIVDDLVNLVKTNGPGALSTKFNEEENCLVVAPAMLEVAGGQHDGRVVFSFYVLAVDLLVNNHLEKVENIVWDTHAGFLSVGGCIGSEKVSITFMAAPFDDEEPEDVLTDEGEIRKKKPPQQ